MTKTVYLPAQIEFLQIGGVLPDPMNARTHSRAQVEQLAQAIREFGWTAPIVIDGKNQIIAGHGRLKAAELLGLPEVPCIRLANLTETQRQALALADNRIALNAGWDESLLVAELQKLTHEGVDGRLLGFSGEELARMLSGDAGNGETDPDEAPEPLPEAVSRRGDVWLLGNHRLICGDSLKRETYADLMQGGLADLVVTDPPYGVAYHADKKGNRAASIEGDLTQAAIPVAFQMCMNFTGKNASFYFFGGTANGPMYSAIFDAYLRMQPRLCVWAKENFLLRPTGYHSQFEQVYFAWKGKAEWYGDRKQSDLWNIRRDPSSERLHPTQKPVGVYLIPIQNSAPAGGVVLEPFSGSGVCLIACEMLGRVCRAIEISPRFVDVGVIRWEKFTGQAAVLESTGETFAQVKNGRTVPA